MGKALDRDTFKRLLSLYRAIMLKIPLVMMDEPGARRYVRSSPPPR
jgi:ABC-type branched-subunit amino acid transport system ATPase component